MERVERVDSVDHLRGILAATIMVYHYAAWSFTDSLSPDGLLSVLGYYGVAAFFVISGMSLAIAYGGRLSSQTEISRFFTRRLFRIAPLYWLAISTTIGKALLTEQFKGVPARFTWEDVVANYTLTFSFGHSQALTTGGWSIGNEIFFYLCFPFLFWIICRSAQWALVAVSGSTILLAVWAFSVVPSGADELEAWGYYISNWNQLFFFVAGVAIGRYVRPASLSRGVSYAALAIALGLLAMADVGVRSDLVESWHRIYLSAATLLLVFSVYQINWQSSSLLGRAVAFLGLISYSLYLLHPLVMSAVLIVGSRIGFGPMTVTAGSVVLTILVSWLSYKLIETPGIRLGKVFEKSLNRRAAATT